MRSPTYIAACLVGAAVVAPTSYSPAIAATIPLSDSFLNSSDPTIDFYIRNVNFTLPPGATNVSLTLTTFYIDDRGDVLLNGVSVASTGIGGPGLGSMVLTQGGVNGAFAFQYGNVGPFTAI